LGQTAFLSRHLAELLLEQRLHGRPDPFRKKHGFAKDMEAVHAIVFNPNRSRKEKIEQYRRWLTTNQPCVFGKVAATNKNIFICLLEEHEVLRMPHGDEDLRDTLQDFRQAWKRYALEGLSSSLVVLLVSKSLAFTEPNEPLKDICRRLLELYLNVPAVPDDTILAQREYVFLRRQAGKGGTGYLKFATLPNIFAAQGDGRWWHDHRTPAGIMITSNAIGHFVYARNPQLGVLTEKETLWALENAMRTIKGAYRPPKTLAKSLPHCPATTLVQRGPEEATPLKSTSDVGGFSPERYEGFFHTDHLVPSVFFHPPRDNKNLTLYKDLSLRYLWNAAAEPQDHADLMVGVPASPYDVTTSLQRLPGFVNPEDPAAFSPPLRGQLAHWLERRLRQRINA